MAEDGETPSKSDGTREMTEYLKSHKLRPLDRQPLRDVLPESPRGVEWANNVNKIMGLSVMLEGKTVYLSEDSFKEIPNYVSENLDLAKNGTGEAGIIRIEMTDDRQPTILITKDTSNKRVRVTLDSDIPTCVVERPKDEGVWETENEFKISTSNMLRLMDVVKKRESTH